MSGQIFISYRREESRWSAGRLYDRLCASFDRQQIFMDIDAIPLGDDFVKAIENTVGKCGVLIAVIGAHWLTSKNEQGSRRLDNPDDFVRMEIATALRRNIRVIPVLVDGALMPQSTDLPDDLKLLVRRNALQVDDTHFDDDCRRLVAAIEQVLEKNTATPREREEIKRLEHEPQPQISSPVAPSTPPAKPEADKLSAETVYPLPQKRPSKQVIVFLTIAAVLVVSGLVYLITIRWSEYTIPGSNGTTNGTTFSSPAIAVESNGKAHVVVQGFNNSLNYYWATPGSQWSAYTIPGSNGATCSSPAIAVRSNGEVDVVVQGRNNSLRYYWATQPPAFSAYTIAGPGGMFVGSNSGNGSGSGIVTAVYASSDSHSQGVVYGPRV